MVEREARHIRSVPFRFTGKTGEYFKIWVVNVFLTLLTLGFYSAWAKVRKKRYFYGNTRLLGDSFEYLGDPIKILKGRLIVLGLLVVYFIARLSDPAVEVITGLLLLALLPWLVVTARAFNARNSSFRNMRFDFKATYGEAYEIFFGLLLLAILTLWIAYPYYASRRSDFLVSHSNFGTTPFEFMGSNTVRSFYGIYLKAVPLSFVLAFFALAFEPVFRIIIQLITSAMRHIPSIPLDLEEQILMTGETRVLQFLVVSLLVFVYVKTKIAIFVWSSTFIGRNHFACTLRPSKMMWLYLSNAVAIVASLGLLIPWASIRTAHYRVDNIKLMAAGRPRLGEFTASQEEEIGAAGEEISGFFDVDVGI